MHLSQKTPESLVMPSHRGPSRRTKAELMALAASVREVGQRYPIVAWDRKDGFFDPITGHDLLEALVEAGVRQVWVVVVDGSKRKALEMRLQKLAHSSCPAEIEMAGLIQKLQEEYFLSEFDLADIIGIPAQKIKEIRAMLGLGAEVIRRLSLPGDDDEAVSFAAVREVLAVPLEHRGRAIEMIIRPELQERPLSAKQARAVIARYILLPLRLEEEWQSGGGAEWCALWLESIKSDPAYKSAEIAIRPAKAEERVAILKHGIDPLKLVPAASLTPDAPVGLKWIDMAILHGIELTVLAPKDPDELPNVYVARDIIAQAEAAIEAAGRSHYLLQSSKKSFSDYN